MGPTRLTLLGRAFDGFERATARQAAAWPGGDVTAHWQDIERLEREVLDSDALLDGSVDLALVVSDWIPALLERGAVADLAPHLQQSPPPDWPDGWSPSLRGLQARGASVYGMPYHDGPMLLLYRDDLFRDPQEQAGFARRHGYPLRPPGTWAELTDQAHWFTRPETGLFGTVLAGEPDGHNDVYDLLLQLWSRGGTVSDAEGRATFHHEPGVLGLEYLRDLRRAGVVDPASMSWDSVTSGQRFADGQAALMVNWAGFAAMSAPPSSPTHGRVRCAPVPLHDERVGSVSLNVYWVLVVASGSRQPDAAYDYLRHVASPDMDLITSLEGATGVRLSTWRSEQARGLSPYYDVIEQVHRSVQSPPALASWPHVVRALTRAVADVMSGRREPRDALADVAAEVDARGWLREPQAGGGWTSSSVIPSGSKK